MVALSPSASAGQSSKYTDRQVSAMQDTVERNRDVFGGLVVDQSTQLVTIFLAPSASPSRRQAALSTLASVSRTEDPKLNAIHRWNLRYVSAGPSLAVLDSIIARVKGESWSADAGAHLISFGIDPSVHAVVVGVDAITDTIASGAQSAFGNLVILKQKDRPHLLSRMLDAQPYWGGDRLVITYWWGYDECTAGFPASDNGNGHRGMLTAGHCGGNGTNMQQGYVDSSGNKHVTGNMGSFRQEVWNFLPDIRHL
jgi:hypothetical protein